MLLTQKALLSESNGILNTVQATIQYQSLCLQLSGLQLTDGGGIVRH
jgi:hypothetical protein